MGLAHPHNGGGGWDFAPYNGSFGSELYPGVSSNASASGGDNYLNSTPYSVMSYNDVTSELATLNSQLIEEYVTPRSYSNYGYNEGLGPFDIATLQYLYGPNLTKGASTDDVYMLDSTTLNGYKTIWDNGGTDTISAVDAGDAVYIDLRSATLLNEAGGGGYISRVDNAHIGYIVAYNTTGTAIIENAIGSSSNDAIIGNSSANSLKGSSGDDSLIGGIGNDVLNGGSGSDVLAGGGGIDTAVFSGANNTVNLGTTSSQGTGDGSDILIGIENVNGGSGKDTITGSSGANTLDGGSGNDTLNGGLGNDRLAGGSGADTAVFSSRNNTVNLGTSSRQNTGDGRDILSGIESVKADQVTTNLPVVLANTLDGGSGNDTLNGGSGNDRLTGGSGTDTAVFSSRNNTVNLGHHLVRTL